MQNPSTRLINLMYYDTIKLLFENENLLSQFLFPFPFCQWLGFQFQLQLLGVFRLYSLSVVQI